MAADELVEQLKQLLAQAQLGTLKYRPDKYDDWGCIRGGGEAFPGLLHAISWVRDSRVSEAEQSTARIENRDPYEAPSRLFVEGINALPTLLAKLEEQAEEIEQLRAELAASIECRKYYKARADRAHARIEALESALLPFAKYIRLGGVEKWSDLEFPPNIKDFVSLGDFRRARNALKGGDKS